MRAVMKIAALGVAAATAAVAAQPAATPPPFRFERPVTGGGGPRRLAIDLPLLAGAAPFRTSVRVGTQSSGSLRSVNASDGLRDLRFYDAGGAEVGYVLVAVPTPEPVFKPATIRPIAPVETDTVKTSGFEADLGEPLLIDRVDVEGLSAPFLKRVTLEGSGDRSRWTVLVADGTLFDLPDERLRHTMLRFAPGTFRYLRLTWDDRHSARIVQTPTAAAGTLPTAPPPPLTAAMSFERRPSEPGRSRFRINLPAGHLPIAALELDAGGGHILREARVFEQQLTAAQLAPRLLGRATLRRVVRDDVTASALQLPIDPPTEAQLDLEVDDEDNPPLDLRGVTAVFAELPWIYLEAPAGGLTARYGNSTLAAPHYDLEAERSQIRIEAIADASWGEPRARSEDENARPAPPLPTFGASLDLGLFTYVRAVPAGEAGLIALPLDVQVLAHSAGVGRRFSDLRVVDDADRQIPYLLEQLAEPLSVDVALEHVASAPATLPAVRSGRSVYRLTYPAEDLPPARLVMTTPARVFDRRVTLGEQRDRDARRRDPWFQMLGTAAWRHSDQDRPARPLTIDLAPPRSRDLFVLVDEGDNTPLPIESARLLLPSYRIRLYRGTGTALRVAYGRRDLPPPQYDLALLAPQVLGASAREVRLDSEHAVAAAAQASALVSARFFWIALALAVVVLVGFIVRLLRQA
ncbi:MAG TPA: DUF3999 family protein [Vicinamibacterales bacterium]|nr:DUF3999 family protein [Vicinamibacterales bacterium]